MLKPVLQNPLCRGLLWLRRLGSPWLHLLVVHKSTHRTGSTWPGPCGLHNFNTYTDCGPLNLVLRSTTSSMVDRFMNNWETLRLYPTPQCVDAILFSGVIQSCTFLLYLLSLFCSLSLNNRQVTVISMPVVNLCFVRKAAIFVHAQ